jgi:serine protease AprX
MATKWIQRASRALMLGLAVLAFTAPASAANKQYDEIIERMLKEGRDDLPIIVRYKDDKSKDRVKKASAKGEKRREMKRLRAMGFRTNRASLLAMLADSGVDSVSYDAPVNAFQLPSLPPVPVSIDASGSRAARSRYGVTGSGVTVAIIDSGVQPSVDLPASRIRKFVDFVNNQSQPYDDYGHGTHVANIIAGSGVSSGGQYVGAAPGADIVALKVLDANGGGATSNVLAALDWVLEHHAAEHINVVNLSLGHPVYEAAATDPMVQAVEELTKQGVVVVVASGNLANKNADHTPKYGTVTSPGNAPSALTVGATNTNGTLGRSDDFIPDFSGRGPSRFDHFMKPDVVAPGYAIMSHVPPASTLATRYPSLVDATGNMQLNGTSMSTPVVAGEVALILSANPGLSAHTVKAVVQYTAQRLNGPDVMNQGAGEVNMAGAVRLARLINPAAAPGTSWLRTSTTPVRADLLGGEIAAWGRATIWGQDVHIGQDIYANLAQWNDNIVWGFNDNIVWGFCGSLLNVVDNIVWSFDDNIVWGFTDDNIVWGFADSQLPLHADNIVWSFNDNIVWGFDDNIVWGFSDDNIVWGFMDNIVWGFSDVTGMSVLSGGL